MSPSKEFVDIKDLCADIVSNYSDATFRDDLDNTYRLTSIAPFTFKGTLEKISSYLTSKYHNRKVKIILLIAEETDG